MKRLLAALLMIVAPAQAQVPDVDFSPEWARCLLAEMRPDEAFKMPVVDAALAIAARCRGLYYGRFAGDVYVATQVIEKTRAGDSRPFEVSPPTPLPPIDKRF